MVKVWLRMDKLCQKMVKRSRKGVETCQKRLEKWLNYGQKWNENPEIMCEKYV